MNLYSLPQLSTTNLFCKPARIKGLMLWLSKTAFSDYGLQLEASRHAVSLCLPISDGGHQHALHSVCWQSTEHELGPAAGYGLDYIWPWLAGFPQDRIAIVDDLCVLRPAKPLAMDTKPMKVSTKEPGRFVASSTSFSCPLLISLPCTPWLQR